MSEHAFGRIPVAHRERVAFAAPMKRAFDIAVSLLALILLAPFLALIAIAIKHDSPGPVIYKGPRVGLGGRNFYILKFRTMFDTSASHAGPRVTAHDDPRITPLGRWLRNTKLNELPQFLNVLRGDMSLVGPRPEDPTLAAEWPAEVRARILSVRPGITSPASVLYHNEEALLCTDDLFRKYAQEVGPDKQRLDQLYVSHRSFCLDADTLLWTVLIMLPMVRSSEPPESFLLVGPFTRLIRRYVNWFVLDWIVAFCAVTAAGLVWRFYAPLNVGWPKAAAAALAFALLFSITGAVLGVHRISWSRAGPDEVWGLVVAWAVAAALVFATDLWVRVLPLGLLTLASLLALCGFVSFRYRTRLITALASYFVRRRMAAPAGREPVLIVGAGANARYTALLLDQPGNAQKFQLAGIVDEDLLTQGMRIYGAKILGTRRDIPKLVATHHVKVVILAEPGLAPKDLDAIADACRAANSRLVRMPDLSRALGAWCGGADGAGALGGRRRGGLPRGLGPRGPGLRRQLPRMPVKARRRDGGAQIPAIRRSDLCHRNTRLRIPGAWPPLRRQRRRFSSRAAPGTWARRWCVSCCPPAAGSSASTACATAISRWQTCGATRDLCSTGPT